MYRHTRNHTNVCVHVVHVCAHTHTRAHTHTHTHAHAHTHITHTATCKNECTHACVQTHTLMHIENVDTSDGTLVGLVASNTENCTVKVDIHM